MRSQFRAKPKSFLDASRRDWQFDTFAWLLRNCGGYPKFLETTLVLPIEEHFPEHGMGGHAAVAALFRRVRDHAGMADWPCDVAPAPQEKLLPQPSVARTPVITYTPDALEPTSLVATFSHELARHLIETFAESAPGGASLHEPALEIAAIFMGFGLFMANAAVQTTNFQLNEGEMVHALAMFCLLRKLEPEGIDPHLNPHLRKYLRLAARDLGQHGAKFQQLRSVFVLAPMEVAEMTLPTPAI